MRGRTVLQRLLRGRLIFTPHINPISGEVDGYDFSGPTRFDKLFEGLGAIRPAAIDPNDRRGKEGIGPEDTFDAAYGRLLDRASAGAKEGSRGAQEGRVGAKAKAKGVKVLASPTGFANMWSAPVWLCTPC